MSYLTDAEKASITADFTEANSTWLRPLTVWQEAAKTVIVSNPDYNPYTSYNQNVTDIQNTPISSVISGAILWDKMQDWPFMRVQGVEAQMKVHAQTKRAVRLKTDASGYSLLSTCKLVEIDGVALTRDTEPRPHGLFGIDRYTFYFQRS